MEIFFCHSIIDGRHAFGVAASIVTKGIQVPQAQYAPRQFFFMADEKNSIWLTTSIKYLPLSKQFKTHAEKNDYNTLQDMLKYKAIDILNQEGFTHHLMQEYVQFLEEKKLTHLLKQ